MYLKGKLSCSGVKNVDFEFRDTWVQLLVAHLTGVKIWQYHQNLFPVSKSKFNLWAKVNVCVCVRARTDTSKYLAPNHSGVTTIIFIPRTGCNPHFGTPQTNYNEPTEDNKINIL